MESYNSFPSNIIALELIRLHQLNIFLSTFLQQTGKRAEIIFFLVSIICSLISY